jgi:chromosome segregation ATPase
VDSLSEGYTALKAQVSELLKQINAENQIVLELNQLHQEIESKQRLLRNLSDSTARAKAQLSHLKTFLRRLGINPSDYVLEISSNPDLDAASTDEPGEIVAVEAEVDPLPFNPGSDEPSHEF